jgi:hypothetical protein
MAECHVDHNVGRGVVVRLRMRGHTLVTAAELGLERGQDNLHLLEAARQGRVLLTHNLGDFTLLHDAWRRWSVAWGVIARHAGVIVPPQEWPRDRIAAEVHAILTDGLPLANELYHWVPGLGWVRRP